MIFRLENKSNTMLVSVHSISIRLQIVQKFIHHMVQSLFLSLLFSRAHSPFMSYSIKDFLYMYLLIQTKVVLITNHSQTLYRRYTKIFPPFLFRHFLSSSSSLAIPHFCCLCSVETHITLFSLSTEHISSHWQRATRLFLLSLF